MVATIAMACGISFLNSQKSEALSDIALANVEALADKDYTSAHSCSDGGIYCSLHLNGRLVFESRTHHAVYPEI